MRDAFSLDTPARLIDYLCARLGESPGGPPLVQTAFYWLRRALAEELSVTRSAIRPATRIGDLTERPEDDVRSAVAGRLAIHPRFLTLSSVVRWLAKLVRTPGRSVGDLATQLAMSHPAAFKRGGEGWTRAQITEVAFRLLEHETGLSLNSSHAHASFVRDLDMG